jgi:hypothetical protein
MKEATCVCLKDYKDNQSEINRILSIYYSEGWVLIRTQYIPVWIQLPNTSQDDGSLLLFFERDTNTLVAKDIEELRESLASIL